MKKYIFLTLILTLGGLSPLSAQVLTNFSSSLTDPNPLTVADLQGGWITDGVISTSGLVETNAPNQSGNGIADVFTNPILVTQGTNFLTLTASLQSQPSIDNFSIYVYDSTFSDYNVYDFLWSSFNHAGGIAFSGAYDAGASSGTFNGTVGGYELFPGGTTNDVHPNVSASFSKLEFTATFVPEPSTYAMFGFGLFMLYVISRRKSAKTVRA